MDRWKAKPGRSRARKKLRRGESQKGEDQWWRKSEERRCRCAKGRKVAKHLVFPMFCGSGGSASRLAKAAGAEPALQVKIYEAPQHRSTFRSWDAEKVHAIVARSTFGSQIVQIISAPDHFWKLRCRKRCTPLWREAHLEVKSYKSSQLRATFGSWDVEKVHAVVARSTFWVNILKKYHAFGSFFDDPMSKKCRPFWREAYLEVKNAKKMQVLSQFWGVT